ncbi:hypothetical protein B0H13DRAFT_1907639 [Mycena leptocephala]|nr:hypothetical protein B0H13DRAFT_1907639 [Mycena leptocephala]
MLNFQVLLLTLALGAMCAPLERSWAERGADPVDAFGKPIWVTERDKFHRGADPVDAFGKPIWITERDKAEADLVDAFGKPIWITERDKAEADPVDAFGKPIWVTERDDVLYQYRAFWSFRSWASGSFIAK